MTQAMARMILGISFVFTIMICVGRNPVAGQTLEMLHVTISENEGDTTTNDVGVCFNAGGTDLTGYTKFQLDIVEDLDGTIFYKPLTLSIPDQVSSDPICTKCKTLPCLTATETEKLVSKGVAWALHVEVSGSSTDLKPSLEYHVTITMPAPLPVASPPEGIYFIGANGELTFKLPNAINTGKLFLDNEEFIQTCDNYPCYGKTTRTGPITGVSFMICDDSSEVLVCGNPTKGTHITNIDELSITSVSVDYTSGAAVAKFVTNGKFSEVINLDTLDGYDTLVGIPMTGSFEATLVDLTTNEEKSQRYNVKDRILEAYELASGSGVLEVKWAKLSDNYYFMSRTSLPDDASPKAANVDCSFVDSEFCNAYFVGLGDGAASHDIQIQKITSFVDLIPEDDIWKVTSATSISLFGKHQLTNIAKEFQVIPIESVVTTVSESSIELDVCFKYITNISKVDTHYEFLAVNSKGKWKKEIADKKIYESQACFQGLELQLSDFSESSKFFVLLRDSSNGKPIASGEVTLDLPAVRAIKPEVDNGNNGSTSTLAIVGAAIAGIACLMALVAAAIMFVMKINRNNDGLQYPLQHNNIEDSSTIHGLDNSIPTM